MTPPSAAWGARCWRTRARTALHLARVQSRLAPRLLEARMTRARDRLEVLGRRATASLTRSTGPRRVRLERVAGRLVAAGHRRSRGALP